MSTTENKQQVVVSTKQLKIWYILEEMSADQIAVELNTLHGINCNGEQVVALIKERKIQTRNIRRSEPTFVFTDPDNSTTTVETSSVKVSNQEPIVSEDIPTEPSFTLVEAASVEQTEEQYEQEASNHASAQHAGFI